MTRDERLAALRARVRGGDYRPPLTEVAAVTLTKVEQYSRRIRETVNRTLAEDRHQRDIHAALKARFI